MSDDRSKFIYEQLNTLKLGSEVSTSIQALQDQVNIQSVNIEAMMTYNLINKALFRDSGNVMPDKGTVLQLTQGSDSDRIYVQPSKGEVYEIMGISATVTGVSGSNQYVFNLCTAEGQTAAQMVQLQVTDSGSTNVRLFPSDSEGKFPLTVTNKMFLEVFSDFDNQTGTTDFKIAYIQRR